MLSFVRPRIETFTRSKWTRYKDKYDRSLSHPSKTSLLAHFNNDESYAQMCHLGAVDVDFLDFPASQSLLDHWHRSAKTAKQYTDALSDKQIPLSQPELADLFIQFTRLFYSPIQLHLAQNPDHEILDGDIINRFLQLVLYLAWQVQQQEMPKIDTNRGSTDIDVQCVIKTKQQRPSSSSKQNQLAKDDDAKLDEADSEHYTINEQSEKPVPAATILADSKKYDLRQELDKTVERMARDLFRLVGIDGACNQYNHFLLQLDHNGILQMEKTSNTVPQCSIEYVPICRLFNTIEEMKCTPLMSNEMVINTSLHKYSDHVSLYLLLSTSDAKVLGSCVDLHELFAIMHQLCGKENTCITTETQYLLQRVSEKFNKDPALEKITEFMTPQRAIDDDHDDNDDDEKEGLEVDLVGDYVSERLRQFALIHNEHVLPYKQVNIYELRQIFYAHDFNAEYFHMAADQSGFVEVLQANGIPMETATELWSVLTPPLSTGATPNDSVSSIEFEPIIGTYMYLPKEYELLHDLVDYRLDGTDYENERVDDSDIELEEGSCLSVQSIGW